MTILLLAAALGGAAGLVAAKRSEPVPAKVPVRTNEQERTER